MDFTNLVNVTEKLYIGGIVPPTDQYAPSYDKRLSYSPDTYAESPSIDVSFPSVKSAMAIDIWGNISRYAVQTALAHNRCRLMI